VRPFGSFIIIFPFFPINVLSTLISLTFKIQIDSSYFVTKAFYIDKLIITRLGERWILIINWKSCSESSPRTSTTLNFNSGFCLLIVSWTPLVKMKSSNAMVPIVKPLTTSCSSKKHNLKSSKLTFFIWSKCQFRIF
jgi:hypothetical protein